MDLNNDAKRVALLLPDLRGGGAERITVNLANAFIARNYLVDVVLLSETGPFLKLLHPNVRVVNLKVNRIRGLLLPLIRYLRQTKPDVMVANIWPLTSLAVFARGLASVTTRLVLVEHIGWSGSKLNFSIAQRFVIRFSMRIFYPYANAIVAVSNGAADDLAKFARLSRNKISTIYNPVTGLSSVEQRSQLEESGWTKARVKILTVGTLKEQKNHELLIRAFALVCRCVNAHLLILGEGNLRSKLEILIDDLKISDRVTMPGFVSDPRPYYDHATVFVLSSSWEGLPTVLIEALDAGIPVVSTDCPTGPREILDDGKFGLLVPVGDVNALAAAMLKVLDSPHESKFLKERALAFSVDKSADCYLKLMFSEVNL